MAVVARVAAVKEAAAVGVAAVVAVMVAAAEAGVAAAAVVEEAEATVEEEDWAALQVMTKRQLRVSDNGGRIGSIHESKATYGPPIAKMKSATAAAIGLPAMNNTGQVMVENATTATRFIKIAG